LIAPVSSLTQCVGNRRVRGWRNSFVLGCTILRFEPNASVFTEEAGTPRHYPLNDGYVSFP